MTLPGVLVLGALSDTVLRDIIFDMGFAPVFCTTILAAMSALRRDRFQAIVVDCENTEVDVLELVLNIRDVDEAIDIFVVSDTGVRLVGLDARRGIAVVGRAELSARLAALADGALDEA